MESRNECRNADHSRRLNRRTFVRLSGAVASLALLPSALSQNSDPFGGAPAEARKYNEGDGVAINYSKAAELFQQAADAGSLDAQAWLGSMYLRGHGVAKDGARAAELIKSSANAGSPVGLRFTGLLYEKGPTVSQDYLQAKSWYEQAADRGDAVACRRLGMLYLFGRGVRHDAGMAREYLSAGASGGDSWSMVELGMFYKHDAKSDRRLGFAQFGFTRHVYEVQYWTTLVIFLFSMALVAAGLWFSWLQFRIAHNLGRALAQQDSSTSGAQRDSLDPATAQEKISITKERVAIQSWYIGVIILALSMIFLSCI